MSEFIETPAKKYKTEKGTKMKKKPTAEPVAKEPKSIKLSTIWKTLVYTFAVIGVILSVMYARDAINGMVDSRAEAKAQELFKAQPATEVAPAAELKANQ